MRPGNCNTPYFEMAGYAWEHFWIGEQGSVNWGAKSFAPVQSWSAEMLAG